MAQSLKNLHNYLQTLPVSEPIIRIKGLKPYQERAVQFMLANQRCINRGPTGSGKTAMAAAAMDAADLFPAVVVCPAAVKLQWAAEMRLWLPGKTVSVIRGKTKDYSGQMMQTFVPDSPGSLSGRTVDIPVNDLNADIVIVNCDIAWTWAQRLAERGNLVIVVDESAFLKDEKTYQTRACFYLANNLVYKNRKKYQFCLTANTVINKPADLIGQLKFINKLKDFGGWKAFAYRFCALTKKDIVVRGGQIRTVWDYSGSSNEEELNNVLAATIMYTVTRAETHPGLSVTRVIVPIDISNWTEYRRAETDFMEFVRELAAQDQKIRIEINSLNFEQLHDRIIKVDPAYDNLFGSRSRAEQINIMKELLLGQHIRSKAHSAARAEALVKMGILRRLVGIGKINGVIEWLKEFHEAEPDQKTLIGALNIEVQDQMFKAFPNSAVIRGGQGDQDRENNKRRFQTDLDCKDCVISMKAGKLGLNLEAAYHTLTLQLPDTWETVTQFEGRAFARTSNPHSITSTIFIAPGTIDEQLLKMLERKKSVAEKVEDGTESTKIISQSIEDELLDWFLSKVTE